jgi:hypothetical protein
MKCTPQPLKTRKPLHTNVRFPGLSLIQPRKPQPESSPVYRNSSEPLFSAVEMRHSFAIWALKEHPGSGRRLHLYYCLRCKWSFSVDDRRGSVTPLTSEGKPIEGRNAAARLATFGLGPCPVFDGLIASSRLTQVVTPVDTARRIIATLISAGQRVCSVTGWQWSPSRSAHQYQAQMAAKK